MIAWLSTFGGAFNTNEVYNGAAMWLLPFLMQEAAPAALISEIALSTKARKHCKNGKLTSYSELVNYLLETYATEDAIVEMGTRIVRLRQPSDM